MEGGIILHNFITRETCAALLYFFYFLVMLLLNAKFKISCLSLGIFFINFFINSGGFFFLVIIWSSVYILNGKFLVLTRG